MELCKNSWRTVIFSPLLRKQREFLSYIKIGILSPLFYILFIVLQFGHLTLWRVWWDLLLTPRSRSKSVLYSVNSLSLLNSSLFFSIILFSGHGSGVRAWILFQVMGLDLSSELYPIVVAVAYLWRALYPLIRLPLYWSGRHVLLYYWPWWVWRNVVLSLFRLDFQNHTFIRKFVSNCNNDGLLKFQL